MNSSRSSLRFLGVLNGYTPHAGPGDLVYDVIDPGSALSGLKKKFPSNQAAMSEKEAHIITTFHKKLALPWLCLIAVIGVAPFCVRFSRHFPVFFIYAFGIFGLLGFYLVLDSAAVLGNRQVFAPLLVIWTPFLLLTTPLLYRFSRLQ